MHCHAGEKMQDPIITPSTVRTGSGRNFLRVPHASCIEPASPTHPKSQPPLVHQLQQTNLITAKE